MQRRMRLRISGRVQGVSYRAYAQAEARRLGLAGAVWNEPDGSVSLVAEGEEQALAALEAWCWRGSPYAHVTAVAADHAPATGEFTGFPVRRPGGG